MTFRVFCSPVDKLWASAMLDGGTWGTGQTRHGRCGHEGPGVNKIDAIKGQ